MTDLIAKVKNMMKGAGGRMGGGASGGYGGGMPSSSGGGGSRGGVNSKEDSNIYTSPKGGGGKTASINVNGKTVTFGHGDRHLEGTGLNINNVNQALAKEVSSLNLGKGEFYKGKITLEGFTIQFTSYGLGNNVINIGTYYLINNYWR